MTYGYTTVWKDALSQINTVTKLEQMNMMMGVSNMSEDEMVAQQNYFQGEPMRFTANLYWFNRAPDYLNRMTILIAYMKK